MSSIVAQVRRRSWRLIDTSRMFVRTIAGEDTLSVEVATKTSPEEQEVRNAKEAS
jgi:hypothetical protein